MIKKIIKFINNPYKKGSQVINALDDRKAIIIDINKVEGGKLVFLQPINDSKTIIMIGYLSLGKEWIIPLTDNKVKKIGLK